MFVIKHPSGQYFHKDNQIILYENPEQATIYINAFAEWGMNKIAQQQMEQQMRGDGIDPFAVMEFQNELSQCRIMSIDFDLEQHKDKVKTIWMHELEN
jgi:hypothetical protein